MLPSTTPPVSLSATWEDSRTFIRRESGLLFPLAFATLWLGNVGLSVLGEFLQAHANQPAWQGMASLGIFVLLIWVLIGQFSLIVMTLHPGVSVGESLRLAARRLGVIIIASFIVGFGQALLMLPLAPRINDMMQGGIESNMPTGPELVWMMVIFVVFIWLQARLLLLHPLLLDTRAGPIEGLRSAFSLTKGRHWPMLEVVGLSLGLYLVLLLAARVVLGSALLALGRLINQPQTGHMLDIMVQSGVEALFVLVFSVFSARLYLRIVSPANGTGGAK
ncbi:MAG: hypothetical protein KGQ42_04750 [Alphaproteobacteria bacterium]|nr:hypothetical protein [Alphaproteobacteria bacterium]MDE2042843.1 hypothetical protein [Alphaproteobacteria bacterium]MDE2341131.1 hypothetical protein [Alphaproteobacteria bacterium]